MSLWDGLVHATAEALAASLTEEQKKRGTALIVARSVKSDGDASDLMILSNYIITGFEIIPEPKDDPYPHASGDVTVLGPQIFSSTTIPAENTVLNWQGENFVPQRDTFPHERPPEEEPPNPPDYAEDPDAPAPMAGAHWRGRRGGQSG